MFDIEYRSFMIIDEPKYDMFEFDDLFLLLNAYLFLCPIPLLLLLNWNLFLILLSIHFWGPMNLFLIIASDLDRDQEENVIVLLRENKEVICQTLVDINGSSPSIVQHRIYLEDNAKHYRDC